MSYIDNLIKYSKDHYFYKEAMEIGEKFDTDAYVVDGIVRWKSSNNIPPTDILELWQYLNKKFSFKKSIEISKKETQQFLNEYRKSIKEPSQEELYEMRSAFGTGKTVVNVITGKRIRL